MGRLGRTGTDGSHYPMPLNDIRSLAAVSPGPVTSMSSRPRSAKILGEHQCIKSAETVPVTRSSEVSSSRWKARKRFRDVYLFIYNVPIQQLGLSQLRFHFHVFLLSTHTLSVLLLSLFLPAAAAKTDTLYIRDCS